MRTLSIAFLSALAIAFAVAPIVLLVARRYGSYDEPESERKIHKRNIPRYGGIAIVFAFLGPVAALYLWNNAYHFEVFGDLQRIFWLIFLSICAFALGFTDDVRGVAVRWKLLGQFGAGALAWVVGFRIESLGLFGSVIEFGPIISILLTIIWFALVINAINLIDGLDGLAGGIIFIVTASVFVLAVIKGATFMAFMSAALAGGVFGFLFFNFSPARLFMGDGGSYFLGFIIAALTLDASLKTSAVCLILMPLLALGIPIFDTVYAFLRRMAKGIPFCRADKKHIHHRLREMGFNSRQAVAILYLATATGCFIAMSMAISRDSILLAGIVVYGATLVIIIRLAGLKGMANTVLHIVGKYKERKRRYRAYAVVCEAVCANSGYKEVSELLINFCRIMKCTGFRLYAGERPAIQQVMNWANPKSNGGAKRHLVIPLCATGDVVGEIEFTVANNLGEVFSRDQEYFNSIAWHLSKWVVQHELKPIEEEQSVNLSFRTFHKRRALNSAVKG